MVHLHLQCQIWGRGQEQMGLTRQVEEATYTVQSLTVVPGRGSRWHLGAWTFPGPKLHHLCPFPFWRVESSLNWGWLGSDGQCGCPPHLISLPFLPTQKSCFKSKYFQLLRPQAVYSPSCRYSTSPTVTSTFLFADSKIKRSLPLYK